VQHNCKCGRFAEQQKELCKSSVPSGDSVAADQAGGHSTFSAQRLARARIRFKLGKLMRSDGKSHLHFSSPPASRKLFLLSLFYIGAQFCVLTRIERTLISLRGRKRESAREREKERGRGREQRVRENHRCPRSFVRFHSGWS